MPLFRNIRSFALLCMLLVGSDPVFGQVRPVESAEGVHTMRSTVAQSGQSDADSVVLQHGQGHLFCGTDLTSAAARRSHEAYRTARSLGALPVARKSASPPNIGDLLPFRVIDQFGTTEAGWAERTFELIDKEPGVYYLWADVNELPLSIDVPSFRASLLDATPSGSLDPTKGILENDQFYFGPPPNYDQDGMTDIILYDIGTPSSNTAGFVSSADIDPFAPDSVGNQADVLYLDARLSTLSAAVVTAHEYTHLLHLASGWDLDYTFATEGYAEYAMVINGYAFWRGIDYLNTKFENSGGALEFEYTRPLFDWRFSPESGGPAARDYQRGGLFFTYVGNQFGPSVVGAMLQSSRKGPKGMEDVLALEGASMKDVVGDFHTANLLNDAAVDPRFSYVRQERMHLKASLTQSIDGEVPIQTGEGLEYVTNVVGRPLKGGAVQYVEWREVSDFRLKLDVLNGANLPPDAQTFQRGKIGARLVGVRPGGQKVVYESGSLGQTQLFSGRFASLTLVVIYTDPGIAIGGNIEFYASWVPLSQATASEPPPEVPTGVVLGPNYPDPFAERTTIPFELDRSGPVRLSVYDATGRLLKRISDGYFSAGPHRIVLDSGSLPSGVYFYRLETDRAVRTRAMRILR